MNLKNEYFLIFETGGSTIYYGEAYVTLSCLGGNYHLMISTNQNVIYIDCYETKEIGT